MRRKDGLGNGCLGMMSEIENDFGRVDQTYTICPLSGSMLHILSGDSDWFRWMSPDGHISSARSLETAID